MYTWKELVSIGIGHYADLDGELIEYKDNLVVDYQLFDNSNMFNCQYLNLRGSSFNHLETGEL